MLFLIVDRVCVKELIKKKIIHEEVRPSYSLNLNHRIELPLKALIVL